MTNEKIQSLARQVDEHYDAQLYRGMPTWLAIRIEEQRTAAHAELTRQVIMAALQDWQRPGR